MDTLDIVYRQKHNLVTRNVGNESVIVPLRNNVAEMDILYTLNETGVFIWQLIDGQTTGNQIVDAITREFTVDASIAAADVLEVLKQMDGKVIEKV